MSNLIVFSRKYLWRFVGIIHRRIHKYILFWLSWFSYFFSLLIAFGPFSSFLSLFISVFFFDSSSYFWQEGGKEISQVLLDDRTKRAEAWHRNAAARAQYTRPAQPITCATFAQDVIEGRAKASQVHEHKHQPLIFGPASLVGGNPSSERERMAAQVFQPSYRYIFIP